MKRDMNLIRAILLEAESVQELFICNKGWRVKVENVSDELVGYHVRLLADGGYLLGLDTGHNSVPLVQGLTWKGHDFLDAMRPKGIWDRVVAAASKAGAMTIDAVVEIAKELAKQQLRTAAGLS